MTTFKIIVITIHTVAITLIRISQALARQANLYHSKKLAKTARVFEAIGTVLAPVTLGMIIRILFFT